MRYSIIFLTVLLVILTSCESERFDYYNPPEWLEGPLFDQIKASGEYEEYVKAAEITGYDKFLSSRLTFTVFVPTNEAFQEYYNEKGLSSINDIDKEELLTLLQYHTMENSWDSTKLVGKTSWNYWGQNPDAFRTPSKYTPPVRKENDKWVYFDNTFLLLFSSAFFNFSGYLPSDYEYFFPGTSFSGFNIDRASVTEKALGSENGFYYVINRVLQPRTTADESLATKPEFSLFKRLLDFFVKYDYNATVSAASSEYDELYKKSYALNFNLANERTNLTPTDSYYKAFSTVFAPENDAILSYFAETFPAYATIDDVPLIIIKYFLEAHLLHNKKLFPSILAKPVKEINDFSDEIPYDVNNGITSRTMSSNAMIYGVNEVINSNAFSTVSGPIIKDPNYKIFTMLLELSGEIRSFFKKEIKHVVMILPDDIMTDMGFTYFEGDPVDFTDDRIIRNNQLLSVDEIKSFLQNYISITSKNVNGQDEVFIKTKNNKYLKVANNKVEGLFGEAEIKNVYPAINGTVLEMDRDIISSVTFTIEDYLNQNKDPYSEFFSLMGAAGLLDESGNIGKISLFSGVTLILPSNDAILAAKNNNSIPGNATASFLRGLVQYQVISERTIFTDDEFPAGNYGTDFFENSVRKRIRVSAANGVIEVTDNQSNTFTITSGPGKNIITTNGVIHVVDNISLF